MRRDSKISSSRKTSLEPTYLTEGEGDLFYNYRPTPEGLLRYHSQMGKDTSLEKKSETKKTRERLLRGLEKRVKKHPRRKKEFFEKDGRCRKN